MPAAADALLIAVVDDDSLFRDTISANLREAGYRAITFDNGPAIVDWFAKGNRSAALLLDWQMPVQDGPTTLEQLRAAGHGLPVIFLTGLNQPIFEEKGLKLGAVDFVDKSKSFAIILQRLRIALAAKAPRAGAAWAIAIERTIPGADAERWPTTKVMEHANGDIASEGPMAFGLLLFE